MLENANFDFSNRSVFLLALFTILSVLFLTSAFIILIRNILPRLFGLEPMSSKDLLFMFDSPTNKLLVTSIMTLSSKVTLIQILENLKKFFETDKKARKRIVNLMGRSYWQVDPNFDESNHIFPHQEEISVADLERFVNDKLIIDIDPEHPPYEIHFFENYGEKSAIVFRFHHALSDGLALVSMVISCGDEGSCKKIYSPCEMSNNRKLVLYTLAILAFPYYLIQALVQKKDKNKLHGPSLSGFKSMAWSKNLNLRETLNYCKLNGFKFNDLLTASVIESLNQYADDDLGSLTMTIPFSLKSFPDDGSIVKLENTLAVMPVQFPEANQNLVKQCSEVYKNLKGSLRMIAADFITRAGIILLPDFIMRFIFYSVGKKCTLTFSNVGGPKGAVFYGGKQIESFIGMSPSISTCGVSVTCFSYIDHFILTCYADRTLISDPSNFIKILENTLENYTTYKLSLTFI